MVRKSGGIEGGGEIIVVGWMNIGSWLEKGELVDWNKIENRKL